ncbi:hypothetical protein F5880DRAFT_1609786 [Lentinula raphanica]|nr:hypothetical protein F5880DRAFT_1609786 [Lentinula raphanica]
MDERMLFEVVWELSNFPDFSPVLFRSQLTLIFADLGNPFGRLRSICSQVLLPEPVQILSTFSGCTELESDQWSGGCLFRNSSSSSLKASRDHGSCIPEARRDFQERHRHASNPVWQELVREEIVGLQDCLADTEEVVSSVKLDSLACLNAHIKEILRFYPGVPIVNRIILEDMHITLAKPIPSKKGQDEIEQIFVEKGTRFHYNLAAYNNYNAFDLGQRRWLVQSFERACKRKS